MTATVRSSNGKRIAPRQAHSRRRRPFGVAVVRAGGRYFVVSPPARRAGEFMVIAALDAEFRWVEHERLPALGGDTLAREF